VIKGASVALFHPHLLSCHLGNTLFNLILLVARIGMILDIGPTRPTIVSRAHLLAFPGLMKKGTGSHCPEQVEARKGTQRSSRAVRMRRRPRNRGRPHPRTCRNGDRATPSANSANPSPGEMGDTTDREPVKHTVHLQRGELRDFSHLGSRVGRMLKPFRFLPAPNSVQGESLHVP
jgi:hypothetical protein